MAKITKEEALAVLNEHEQQETFPKSEGYWLNLSKSGKGVYIRVGERCYATTTAKVKLLLSGSLKDKSGKLQNGTFLGAMPEKETQ